ncbi:MAG: NAD(P)-dependent oxidoreductase, partial [Bacteroidetes bacterium]|nr:NAD(P)-dependent oxidoreductase [Bacteroidota bacterium]
MNTSTSIIFGGSGFIGSHLSQIIDNHLIYDIAENPSHDVRKQINIEVYPEALEDIKVIYNLAAIHKTPGHKSYEYFETNILGAENVCNFAREHDIKTIIFT